MVHVVVTAGVVVVVVRSAVPVAFTVRVTSDEILDEVLVEFTGGQGRCHSGRGRAGNGRRHSGSLSHHRVGHDGSGLLLSGVVVVRVRVQVVMGVRSWC